MIGRAARRWAAGVGIALALASGAAAGQLVARVEPGWSPFVRGPVPEDARALVSEARTLLLENPGRVAEILATVEVPRDARRTVAGLRADARYFAGGEGVWEAQRLYRALSQDDLAPDEDAWVAFMLGHIQKGLGFPEAARTEYQRALQGPPGPWRPALAFDLAVLDLEAGRYPQARDGLRRWAAVFPDQPGRAVVLYLLAECAVALGDDQTAVQRFSEARALDPDAWKVRPRTGYALADLLERTGRPAEAAGVLDAIAAAEPGTPEAAEARLRAGALWESRGDVVRAARTYALLIDEGTTDAGALEARLRLALLGVYHADGVELTEPLPAYRLFYRPEPTLRQIVDGRADAAAAQRAVVGLAELAWRAGDRERSLVLLARAFETYPETAESGRAYESFMDRLDAHLARLLEAGDAAGAVEAFAAFRRATRWVANRDVGNLVLRAAEAYERLGAYGLAREQYAYLLRIGTRAASRRDLERRILRDRVREGEPEAIKRWAGSGGGGWRSQLELGRVLAGEGDLAGARTAFARALDTAPGPREALAVMFQAARYELPRAGLKTMLAALERRRTAWRKLPEGGERAALEREGWIVEARLRFAAGDREGAVRAWNEAGDAGDAADRFLRALADDRLGRTDRALAGWDELAGADDPVYAPLAALEAALARLRVRAEARR